MFKLPTEHAYEVGQRVISKVNPDIIMIIRRYIDRIYYCRSVGSNEKDYVFFEREIIPVPIDR